MYLLEIYFENLKLNRSGGFCVSNDHDRIRKWTLLPASASGRELLQIVALSCGGAGFIKRLPFDFRSLPAVSGLPVTLEFVLAPHPNRESRNPLPSRIGSGIRIDAESGRISILNKDKCRSIPPGIPVRKPALDTGSSRYFVLGYGSDLLHRSRAKDFDFADPFFRNTRYHTLFSPDAPLTDPAAFLERLNYRAVRVSRYPAKWTLQRICSLIGEHLEVDTGSWQQKEHDFASAWAGMRPWQQRVLLAIFDAVRHVLDASPFAGKPLEIQGLMLMDRPDRLCPEMVFPAFIRVLDALFPEMQFVITLPSRAGKLLPEGVPEKRLALPHPVETPRAGRISRVSTGTILLVQMDGRLPNLALMKLSSHFKREGKKIVLARTDDAFLRGADAVYASGIFTTPISRKRIGKLRRFYGGSLVAGGSGVDVHLRLPGEIESLPADYSLHPELGDRAIGFLTRGCPFACPFCIVPEKEGGVRQVSDLDGLLDSGRRNKLILLDDNILSQPKSGKLLEEMARRNLQVNFNQTLDLRLVDKQKAGILNRIACSNAAFTRRVIHFSLNDTKDLDRIRLCYAYFGFTSSDNVEFICMYGFNTTLAEDVERFRFLRSLPGAYVFVQEYRPIPGGPEPDLNGFFDESADRLIDELVGIVFTQNMKSMEKYYRWLSKKYVRTFGRLHQNLVDTIFRYNHRDRKGYYMESMAGTIRKSA